MEKKSRNKSKCFKRDKTCYPITTCFSFSKNFYIDRLIQYIYDYMNDDYIIDLDTLKKIEFYLNDSLMNLIWNNTSIPTIIREEIKYEI